MADFVKVATTDKISEGRKMKVDVNGIEIMLTNVSGKIYALEDVCSHEQCSISDGDLEGFVITCPCHGAKYDVRNGNGFKETPWGLGQETFEVKIEGKDVFVKV
ncbi:MAG TPA: Rieske 2Fe-2S domain-containing protein [archaeon]|nr:Rieske 2Fe-2S domain-containing protein [archaeon]